MKNIIKFSVFFLFISSFGFGQSSEEEPIYKIVEQMPRFPGCETEEVSESEKTKCAQDKMFKFIYDNIHYPAQARIKGIGGRVVVRFVVEKDGSISNTEIVRDIGGGCGKAAINVLKKMPNWIPGKQRGKPVRVQYNLPVKFQTFIIDTSN